MLAQIRVEIAVCALQGRQHRPQGVVKVERDVQGDLMEMSAVGSAKHMYESARWSEEIYFTVQLDPASDHDAIGVADPQYVWIVYPSGQIKAVLHDMRGGRPTKYGVEPVEFGLLAMGIGGEHLDFDEKVWMVERASGSRTVIVPRPQLSQRHRTCRTALT